ncbi:hypothetical protein ACP6PL_30815, partial [Dapis sp. BLCC M126]|uniref:hypothetical protein n=1 Tax=Dapis sp. BLCC M126 TaxID=3400189 RepID=UPI003CEA070A
LDAEIDETVAESEDITSESESDETVVEEEDINSDSESPETDDSDKTVAQGADITSDSDSESPETDILTGGGKETNDELLNGESESPLDNSDEFLLAGDKLASIPEIEVLELTTSDTITQDNTTGITIEENDSQDDDPVLAAIENTNNAPI